MPDIIFLCEILLGRVNLFGLMCEHQCDILKLMINCGSIWCSCRMKVFVKVLQNCLGNEYTG